MDRLKEYANVFFFFQKENYKINLKMKDYNFYNHMQWQHPTNDC